MRACAPGKVVLSGAYAVLEGAPCVVTAVDRYVIADSGARADHIADEVRAAMPAPYPHIDANQLRSEGRKLGLGSSAAIVVSSLATLPDFADETPDGLQVLYERAQRAHRTAQGGGSGVDVAASTFGGTLVYNYDPSGPGRTRSVPLPTCCLEIWSCPEAAITSGFLARVRQFKAADPTTFADLFRQLHEAATFAVVACETNAADIWLEALSKQAVGLRRLGTLAEVPIFTHEVELLWDRAAAEGAVVMPAGAGGGDLALFCGRHPPSPGLVALAEALGVRRLVLKLGARGVHRLST